MAVKTYFIGSTGPFTYDDAFFSGFSTDGFIKSTAAPSTAADVVRLEDLGGSVSTPTFDTIQLTTGLSAPAHSEGLIFYDDDEKTLSVYNNEADVTLQLGQEMYIRGTNKTGAQLDDGTVIYIDGAQGNRPTFDKAKADVPATSMAIAIITHDIADNGTGFATTFGLVRGIDTSAWVVGTTLYFSDSVAGAFTSTPPTEPSFPIQVATVITQNVTEGAVLVNIGPTDVAGHMVINSLAINDTFKVGGVTTLNGVSAGVDNTVLVLDSSNNIVSDEIDSRVWGSSLVDGSGTNTHVGYWTSSSTLASSANFTWDGTLLFVNGGTGIPFKTKRTDSGIHWTLDRNGTNIATISTTTAESINIDVLAGGTIHFNANSLNVDFRVESDTITHALFVRGSDGNIGLGTATPSTKLEILTTVTGVALHIHSNTASNAVGINLDVVNTATITELGFIVFSNAGDSVAGIRANRASANDAADLHLATQAASGTLTNRLTILSTGDATFSGILTVNGDQSGATDHVFDDYDDIELLYKWRNREGLPFNEGDLLNRDRLLRDAIIQLSKKLDRIARA